MNALKFTAALLIAMTVGTGLSGAAEKITDSKSEVSVTLPEGWKLQEFPGMVNKIGFGERRNDFTANVNVVSEKFSGTLDAYVKANLKTMKTGLKGFKLVSQQKMKSGSGEDLVRLVCNTDMEQPLRQVFFLLKGKNGYYGVVTCSCALADADYNNSTFSAIGRSISLGK